MTQSRFVVTGGAGFIGSHLTESLLADGHAVTVLDNFCTSKRSNLDGMQGALDVVEGSMCDASVVDRIVEGAAGVFHLAALPSVARSVEMPVESNHNNVTGVVTVLDAARKNQVRVVYAGSSSAYGDQDAEFKQEDMREGPISPYAVTKLVGELYCRSFAQVYGLPSVVTRFFNVFGPRQVPDSPYSGVIAAFCFALLKGQSPRIDGDGSQSRDFTYIADVVRGVRMSMDADTTGCLTVNLACGGSHTILAMLNILREYSGAEVDVNHAPPRNGDVMHSKADVTRIREEIGFTSEVSFAEGLQKTYDWYRSTYA